MDIRKKQKAVVAALEDIKAHDIAAFDVTHLTALFDRVIIASADSARQTKALAQHVEDKLRDMGSRVVGREGEETGDWILVDFGDIVVHIMQPAVRAHYNLEELWDQPKPRTRRARSAAVAQPVVAAPEPPAPMRIVVVAVGGRMPAWVDAAFGEYAKRMPRRARLELAAIKPEPRTTGKPPAQLMAAEALRIRAAVPQGAITVALDERGRDLSTRELAAEVEKWLAGGTDVACLIGGPDGLDDALKQAASTRLRLSSLTLPHGMCRVLLAEQLYRALSILDNHPYHRE